MYDLVIIGSGYGGSVVASRLAGHGSVLLLERGKRWRMGQFPHGAAGLAGALVTRLNPLGLFGMRLGHGTGNAYASGLGGASLLNYGITTRPDTHVFGSWPVTATDLDPWYRLALATLDPTANPKREVDDDVIERLAPGCRERIANTVSWEHCDACGHCISGCNRGAKRSLDHTYLMSAQARGVDVRCGSEVLEVRQGPASDPTSWELVVADTERPHETTIIPARRVVLAAGTFGTLDLLHRSRAALPLSPMFGKGVSMNGDSLAFLYDGPREVGTLHGAPIASAARIVARDHAGKERTLFVMAGRIPTPLQRMAALTMLALGPLFPPLKGITPTGAAGARRAIRDAIAPRAGGPLDHSFMFKVCAEDAARGEIRFTHSGAVVDWADYGEDPVMLLARARLESWWRELGGRRVPDLGTWPGMRHFGVHPLGGCRMGDTIEDGVVDSYGHVFDPRGGVYPGLRIIDASIIPSALGVPSSLTIAALAERAAQHLVTELAA
jgi:cholesterol oxidase